MTIDEQIEFLTQLKAGKMPQYRPIGRTDVPWMVASPNVAGCNFAVFEYRVKPEPRVIYVNTYPNDSYGVASSLKGYSQKHLNSSIEGAKVVKFIEVIENEE